MPSEKEPLEVFSCRLCGDCCRGYGGTYVSEADIVAISRYIGVDPRSFVETWCVMSGGRPLLRQKESGYCIFWDKVCTIHPVKPRMCRAWPFLESILKDPGNWRAMAGSCPGMRTDLPDDVIVARVREVIERMVAPEKEKNGP